MRTSIRPWDGTDPVWLARELRATAPDHGAIAAEVTALIERVRADGDAAVIELGERLDGAAPTSLVIGREELEAALDGLDGDLRSALEVAVQNIEAVARAQLAGEDVRTELEQGQVVVSGRSPVAAAAIYAPGGRAVYPSSVLMGVIPARVAGVRRIVVASPPQEGGSPAPAVIAAAALAGAEAVVAAGGAQAIAALAHGTESIEPVDVIAGPGGPWVQEAKLQVSRVVGIDGYAGPSELMVVCDGGARAEWIALDLCAQAEHGADGALVVAGTDRGVLDRIASAAEDLARERPSVSDAAVDLVEAPDLGSAAAFARAFAPEHLQLDCEGAEELAADLSTAGCVFVGAYAGTAFGDYAAGSNHTLPTGGAGRFTGPVGPETFMRRTSSVLVGEAAARSLAPTVVAVAESEGFPVHGESAAARAPRDGSS